MPGGVVRRRGETPVGEALAPIRLAFELGAVTGGAMLRIDRRSARDQARAFRIGPGRIVACQDPQRRSEPEQGNDCGPNQPMSHRRSRHSFMKMLDWPSAPIA